MKISGALNGVFDEILGWRPSSSNTKPAQVANGMFRELCGNVNDISDLLGFIIPTRRRRTGTAAPKKGGRGDFSHAGFIRDERNPDRKRAFAGIRGDESHCAAVREAAGGLLNADRCGFFDLDDKSSLTIASESMVSADTSDRRIGRFFGHLLQGTDMERAVLDALRRGDAPDDPLSCLAWPLVDPAKSKKFGEQYGAVVRIDNGAYADPEAAVGSSLLHALSLAASNLASHERAQGNRLRTLQRATLLCSLGVVSQIQHLAAARRPADRPPVVLTFEGGASPIDRASAMSVVGLVNAFEDFLVRAQSERLAAGEYVFLDPEKDRKKGGGPSAQMEAFPLPDDLDEDVARTLLSGVGKANASGSAPDPATLDARLHIFRESVMAVPGCTEDRIAKVYGRTLVHCYVEEYKSGGAARFLHGFFSRVGLLYPHFGKGRARSAIRFHPAPRVLDTVVRCCVAHEEEIAYDEFLERLWTIMGIVVGGRPDDRALMARHDITVEPETLLGNSDLFLARLEEMGLAKRYADGIAFVGAEHD